MVCPEYAICCSVDQSLSQSIGNKDDTIFQAHPPHPVVSVVVPITCSVSSKKSLNNIKYENQCNEIFYK